MGGGWPSSIHVFITAWAFSVAVRENGGKRKTKKRTDWKKKEFFPPSGTSSLRPSSSLVAEIFLVSSFSFRGISLALTWRLICPFAINSSGISSRAGKRGIGVHYKPRGSKWLAVSNNRRLFTVEFRRGYVEYRLFNRATYFDVVNLKSKIPI